ncbi:MAG: MotA/TolQ/ExbB proton channel family protein [Chitinispirillales bacterium]|jgi:chemotaxis protein MotA|nr:MotA/TolQ/ExbB proton channel family protein [Chitinispirillales bacterium]
MDFATIIGLILATGVMIFGMGLENLNAFIDMPSVIIVCGGTIAAGAIGFPPAKLMGLVAVTKNAFFVKSQSPVTVITQIIKFAEQARREGILALESQALEIKDEFLKQGIQLAVDGTEPDLIKEILSTEIAYTESRHSDGAKLMEFLGAMSPAFGMLGTVIGLVLMLGNMSDIETLGPNMAIALITTLYGALMANIVFIPLAEKLKTYSGKEVMIKELMLEGIMSLQSGDNPRIVEQKLTVFLEPMLRASVLKEKK